MNAISSTEEAGRTLRTWEFHLLVLESFLLVAAEGAIWGIAGHKLPLPRFMLNATAFLAIELTLLPIQTAVARIYYSRDVRAPQFALWAIAAAVLFGALVGLQS